MNDLQTTETTPLPEAGVAALAVHFDEVTGQFIDSEGNPAVTVSTEEAGYVTDEGDVTTPDVTIH